MNILIVTGHFPTYPETFVWNQVKILVQQGHHVHLVSHNRGEDSILQTLLHERLEVDYRRPFKDPWLQKIGLLMKTFLSANVNRRVILKSINPFMYGRNAWSLFQFYQVLPFITLKRIFDVVHAHHGGSGVYAYEMKKMGAIKAKILTTFHGSDINQKQPKGWYDEMIKKGELFTANSAYTMQNMIKAGFSESKIRLVPMGVNTNFFQSSETKSNGGVINLLYVGRLIEIKGVEFAIRALNILTTRGHRNIRLIIIGDGILKPSLELLAEELSLSKLVEFRGYQNTVEVKKSMEEADVFLLTGITDSSGRQEAQGLVIQEAQSMGLPVVVSDVGGIKHGMTHGVTGFLCREKDPNDIADKLEMLIVNEEIRFQMGIEARKLVLLRFSMDNMMKEFHDIYEELAEK